jgi:hypothetical protein
LKSEIQQERDLYFSTLLNICNSVSSPESNFGRRVLAALWKEWEFLQVGGYEPSASLARTLVNAFPEEWPRLLAVICESNWPVEKGEPLDKQQFAWTIQNIVCDLDAAAIASNLWFLAPYFCENPDRAISTLKAIFGDAECSDDDEYASFRLVVPRSDFPVGVESWKMAARQTTKYAREFPISRGDLDDVGPLVSSLGYFLGAVSVMALVFSNAA